MANQKVSPAERLAELEAELVDLRKLPTLVVELQTVLNRTLERLAAVENACRQHHKALRVVTGTLNDLGNRTAELNSRLIELEPEPEVPLTPEELIEQLRAQLAESQAKIAELSARPDPKPTPAPAQVPGAPDAPVAAPAS